jgi:ABC-type branched-subunit amino acid transport system ATPase component
MTPAITEVAPTGGVAIAPRFEDEDIARAMEVGSARTLIPSAREQLAGRRVEYVEEQGPEAGYSEPSLWQGVKGFVREMDPREITRDAPRFPLFLLTVSAALGAFDLTSFLGPEIQQDIGLPLQVQIAIGSMMGQVGLLASPLFGYLADHVKRVTLIRIGSIINGVASLIQPFAPGPSSYLGISIVNGIGNMVQAPAVTPMLADYYPVRARTRMVAFLAAVGAGAGVIGPLVGGPVGQALGWRMAMLITNIVGLVLIAGVFWLKEPVRGFQDRKAMGVSDEIAAIPQPPMSFAESWRAAYSIKTLRRSFYAIPFAAIAGQGVLLQSYYFQSYWHTTPAARGIIAAISSLPTIPIMLLAGALGDRMLRSTKPGRLVIYGQLLAIAGSLILIVQVFTHNLVFSIITGFAFALPGAVVGFASAAIGSLVIPARFRATGATASLPFAILGGILTPVAYNFVFETFGLRYSIIVLAVFGIIASLISMLQASTLEGDIRRSLASSLAQQDVELAAAAGENKLLVLRGVDMHYGGTQVVFGVDLDVYEGEILALLGTNGSGKSTLLRAIAGLDQSTGGAIYFDGVDSTHVPPYEQAKRGVVMVPGGRAIFPTLTVEENLRSAVWIYRQDHEYARQKTEEMMKLFPRLRERLHQQAGNLSGGEQQQLCLAQAFLMKPRLLMVDELTLGLAPQVVEQLLDVLRDVNASGTTIIIVEQSINLALTIAERAVFMEKGQVRYDGPTVDLLSRSDVARSVYLGEATASRDLGATRTRVAIRSLAEEEDDAYEHLLEVRDVQVEFGGVSALQGVSFDMEKLEILGIIGANGAGKTTLFDVISGFIRPPALTSGHIVLAGNELDGLSPDRRHYAGLCRSFQNVRLFSGLTARETIAVAFERYLTARNPLFAMAWLPNQRRAEQKIFRRVDTLVEVLGLGAFANKFMDELSTGSRRLVEIACLLAAGPKLLLLDEPSSGLAQAETEELTTVIQRIRLEAGCGILVIEHDLPLITGVSDRLVAMELGKVITIGSPAEVAADKRVVESYLGTSEEVLMRSGTLSSSATAAIGAARRPRTKKADSGPNGAPNGGHKK